MNDQSTPRLLTLDLHPATANLGIFLAYWSRVACLPNHVLSQFVLSYLDQGFSFLRKLLILDEWNSNKDIDSAKLEPLF